MSGADVVTLPQERRHTSRVSTDLDTRRRASTQLVRERIGNLSTGGLLLRGKERLSLGTRTELTLRAPSGNLELTVRAEVVRVWCGVGHDELLTGLRFVGLDARTTAQLEVLLIELMSAADVRRSSHRFELHVPALWTTGAPGAPLVPVRITDAGVDGARLNGLVLPEPGTSGGLRIEISDANGSGWITVPSVGVWADPEQCSAGISFAPDDLVPSPAARAITSLLVVPREPSAPLGGGHDTRFAGCALGAVIRRGQRSTLYRGVPEHPRAGPERVIKHFTGPRPQLDAQASRFGRAVAVSRAVKGGVVASHSSQTEGDECWLAMERVEGRSLDQLLAALATGRHAPPVRAVVSVIGEVLATLERCGRALGNDFAHGSLDAACIYVCADGSVKLGGFDAELDRRARTGVVAPELVLSSVLPTPQSDVFSVGALLYEALTGVPALNVPAHLLARAAQRGPLPPSRRNGAVTQALDRALLAALALEPADRPRGPRGLLDALNACAALAPAAAAGEDRLALLRAAAVAESLRRDTLPRVALPHGPVAHGPVAHGPVGLGSVVGRYTVLDMLGRGDTHNVWLARGLLPDGGSQSAALKTLREDLPLTPERSAATSDEGRLAGRLAHPNLVRVLDTGLHGGLPYVATEYVGGRTLAQVRAAATQRRVEVPEGLAAAIVLQCCAGLQAAHAQSLVHGNLSARHVLVSWSGAVKLIDLGRSPTRLDAVRADPDGLRGALAFVAPEQLRGDRPSPSFDVWALGVNLYLLLTGRLPLEVGGDLKTASAILHSLPQLPRAYRPGLSDALQRICLRALAKRVDDRYPTAEAVRLELARFLGGPDVATGSLGELMAKLFPPSDPERRRLSELEGRVAPRALA